MHSLQSIVPLLLPSHGNYWRRQCDNPTLLRRCKTTVNDRADFCEPPVNLPAVFALPIAHPCEPTRTVTVARGASFTASTLDAPPCWNSTPAALNSRVLTPLANKEFNGQGDDLSHDHLMKWRLASAFFALFVGGWADGVTGTVMPYLVAQFNLTPVLSSSLFAGTTCGYFAGTFLLEVFTKFLGRIPLHDNGNSLLFSFSASKRLSPGRHEASYLQGRHLLLIFASIIHALYFLMMGSRTGFTTVFMAYVFSAFSRALLTAPLNLYFASGPKQALGFGLGLASLGSVVSPFVCQTIIATGVPWYRFYYGSLLLSVMNLLFLGITFKPTPDELIFERRRNLTCTTLQITTCSLGFDSLDENYVIQDEKQRPEGLGHGSLRRLMSIPYQWAISFFVLLYCGSETTTQGFMVLYLLITKHAHPRTIGYVTSGFWGGISLGRFLWGICIPYLSFSYRKHIVHVCIGASISVHLTIWLVNSYVENAIATCVIGILYGPILPACLAMASDILPADVQMVAMALISSFASLGGAIFPLIAGTIFNVVGIKSLPYVTVPLVVIMASLWTLFPSRIPSKPTVD